jgi:hypothetical protein
MIFAAMGTAACMQTTRVGRRIFQEFLRGSYDPELSLAQTFTYFLTPPRLNKNGLAKFGVAM